MTVEIRERFGDWLEVTEQEARRFVLRFCTRWTADIDQLEKTVGGNHLRGCTVHQLFEGHEDELPIRMRGGSESRQSGLGDFL